MRIFVVIGFLNIMAILSAEPSLKIRVVEGRPIADQVFVNGCGPYTFLIDTGAQTNQIESSLAPRLGLRTLNRLEMFTVAGTKWLASGRASEIRLGVAVARDQEFLFSGLTEVRRLSPGIQGILGQEFLANFDYLLDFRGRKIRFGAIETKDPRIEAGRIGGRMAVFTSLGELILDSGIDTVLLYSRPQTEASVRLVTSAGETAVKIVRNSRLMIEEHEYRLRRIAYVPPVAGHGQGLLPASLFDSVFVCNSGNYIIANPSVS